jgi:hypothetical protein
MKELVSQSTGRELTPVHGTEVVPLVRAVNLPNVIAVGDEISVGQFFWIDTCIGMADNAKHGHSIRNEPSPGSADMDCTVRVLDLTRDYATVVLLRPEIPYGAPAPHGTIFLVPIEVLERWPGMTARRIWQEQTRATMRSNLGSVQV